MKVVSFAVIIGIMITGNIESKELLRTKYKDVETCKQAVMVVMLDLMQQDWICDMEGETLICENPSVRGTVYCDGSILIKNGYAKEVKGLPQPKQKPVKKADTRKSPYESLGDTFEFTCTNGSHSLPYGVELLPEDTYDSLREYGKERCAEESSMWNKQKGTKGVYKFSTRQF